MIIFLKRVPLRQLSRWRSQTLFAYESPPTRLLASAAHLKTKRSDRSRVKWVKLAVLHNKSKLTVQVSMVTVLSGAMRDPKVNQPSLRRLRPHAGFCLQPPEMGRWPLATLPTPLRLPSFYASARVAGAPPLHPRRVCTSISIIGLSCIHLSVDAPWYEVAGRRGSGAFPLRVASLPVSPLPFFLSFFLLLLLYFSTILFKMHGYCIVTYFICKQNIEYLESSVNLHVKFAVYLETGNRFVTAMYIAIRLLDSRHQ